MTTPPAVRSDRTRDDRNRTYDRLRLDSSERALVLAEAARRAADLAADRRERRRRHTSRAGQRGLAPTATQLTVLELLARGLTTGAIASWLGVSAATVRTHLARLYGRLEAVNAAHAVRCGYDRGLLPRRLSGDAS